MRNAGVIAAVAIIAIGVGAYILLGQPGSVTGPVPSKFSVNGRTFIFTYVATTEAEREAGLMNTKITNTTTMLFVFPSPGTHPFWMYHTNASLDIIWIEASGKNGTVVFVVSGAPPCPALPCPNYGPSSAANYVIEAKAGFAVANGVQQGISVEFG